MSGKQRDQVMGHGEDNDGIEEYDNPLPDWWLGLFFFTILFAVGYTVEYHLISQRSQADAYDAEMHAALEQYPSLDAPVLVSTDDAEAIAAGAEVFKTNCVACHGENLQGGIGPSLVDDEWIHGSDPESITKTVTEGVAAKGMPGWGPILGPEKVGNVTAYVLSKQEGGT